MTTEVQDQVLADINARLAAIGESVSEERVQAMVQGYLDQALSNPGSDLARRMRFGGGATEPKLVGSKFARWGLGLSDIEFLYDMQTSLRGMPKPGGGVFRGPSEELTNTFNAISEACYVPDDQVRQIDRRAIDDLFPRVPLGWLSRPDRALARQKRYNEMSVYREAMDAIETRTADSGSAGAMDTSDSGYGSSLIGAQYVRDLWDGARPESRVFALFDTFEMTDPVAYLPVEADLPEMLYVGENTIRDATAYTPKKTGSNRVTVTAYKFVIRQIWSSEMEEDSIVPFISFLRRQAQLSIAHHTDSLVLNGDTTTGGAQINTSSDPASTEKHWLAFDGIRHIGLVDNTNNQKNVGGAITFDALLAARARMLDTTYLFDWGHPTRPEDLVYAAEPTTADAIALMDEVITVDKFGSNATVLTGQVARIGQHPLISTMALSKTLATGFVHASTGNSYGVVVPFNRRGFKVGWRRRVKMAAEPMLSTDQMQMVYTLRLGFGRYSPTGAASGIECADVLYNITV